MKRLSLTRLDDRGLLAELDGAGRRANSLEGLDNLHGLLISDLAEDDVAAIEPRGDNGGDEELGAVAVKVSEQLIEAKKMADTYVLGPALAMERRPGRVCFREKFSSANFSP
jgi:hypothetical protein